MLASTFYFVLTSLYEQLETQRDHNFDSLKTTENSPDSLECENISLNDLDSLEDYSVSRETPTDSLNTEDSTFDSLECKSLSLIKSFNSDINHEEEGTEHVPTNVLELLMFCGKMLFFLVDIGTPLSLCVGSYDPILEKIIGYLDGLSVESCLLVSHNWASYIRAYLRSPRVSSLMTLHWKEFVPVQTEIR